MDILFFTGMVFWGMYLNANEDIELLFISYGKFLPQLK